jgi:hypothetical protein
MIITICDGSAQPPVQRAPGSIPWVKRGRGMKLTIHPHLVPRLRMSRSNIFSPPWCLHSGSGASVLLYFTYYVIGLPKSYISLRSRTSSVDVSVSVSKNCRLYIHSIRHGSTQTRKIFSPRFFVTCHNVSSVLSDLKDTRCGADFLSFLVWNHYITPSVTDLVIYFLFTGSVCACSVV